MLLLLLAVSMHAIAQQNHFIYLQTDNKQPFYVKLDKKLISSSASGYLIIPKLQDGDYTLTIGFPKNEFSEQVIPCAVNKKDAGYILKNFGDKGWGLFNFQTLEVVMSGSVAKENTMAATSNKKEETPAAPSIVAKEPGIESKETVQKTIQTPQQVKQTETPAVKINTEVAATRISKLLSNVNAEGTELMYADIVNGVADTVRVFIPVEKEAAIIPLQNNSGVASQSAVTEPATVPQKEDVKAVIPVTVPSAAVPVATAVTNTQTKKGTGADSTSKFLDITLSNPNAGGTGKQAPKDIVTDQQTVSAVSVKPAENTTKPLLMNSDCKTLAAEDDFLKLRKKMAAENSDDDMVYVAKKVFKTKCFSAEQVKNLSVLFLKDEGKYKFFDAAYPFVSDSYNFAGLEAQLSDTYFINRFRVMLRH